MVCKNCVYFMVTEDKEWNGKPHCTFRENHDDYDTAPCDDADYEEE